MEKRAIENLGLEGVVCVNMVYEVVLVRNGWVQGIGGIFCLNLYLGLLVAGLVDFTLVVRKHMDRKHILASLGVV